MKTCFVGLGEKGKKRYLYKDPELTDKLRQVLWGDCLHVEKEMGKKLKVTWAPNSDEGGQVAYILKKHTTQQRPLEVIFVDVGQGDGCVLITPEQQKEERVVVIDAGPGVHMKEFLKKRFESYRDLRFDAAVLTHPDMDHYGGFKEIFNDHRIGFKTVFHNGLVERPEGKEFEKLGGLTYDKKLRRNYLENLAESSSLIKKYFSDPEPFGKREFPPVMHAAYHNENIKDFQMLSTHHGTEEGDRMYMPGFEPNKDKNYAIEVLGPVVEFNNNKKPRLRKLGSFAETKNGHSVLLRLTVEDFSVFFGGDLNDKAEKFLLKHYAGILKKSPNSHFPKKKTLKYCTMINEAAKRLRSDIMKVCHHGSSKVTDAFLEVVHPTCFVISSGDAEGHVHPRPDLLGRLGRHGRGDAPVLLLTELQRSTREFEDQESVDKLIKMVDKLQKNPTASTAKDLCRKVKSGIRDLARSNVEVDGAIYVKTDGKQMIIACKRETDSDTDKWFYFYYKVEEETSSTYLKLVYSG